MQYLSAAVVIADQTAGDSSRGQRFLGIGESHILGDEFDLLSLVLNVSDITRDITVSRDTAAERRATSRCIRKVFHTNT